MVLISALAVSTQAQVSNKKVKIEIDSILLWDASNKSRRKIQIKLQIWKNLKCICKTTWKAGGDF